MPEGDTVWLAGHRLRRALDGATLTRSDFRVPRYATVDLSGVVISDVVSRGKHLLWRLDNGLTLHTHFKMDGAWHLYRRNRAVPIDHEVRAVLETTEWVAVARRMAVLDLIETAREDEVVGHLGPDLLGEDWDRAKAVAGLRARQSMAIGEALLDQTALAGVGNVYKCEICFLRGLDPFTPVERVDDLDGVAVLAKRLLEANRYSARHVTTGDTRPGRSHYVYGRGGRPCLRCGTPVRRSRQASYDGERVVYWCARCQPRWEDRLQAVEGGS